MYNSFEKQDKMDMQPEERGVQGGRTIQQYRAIDLSLIAVILIIFEIVIVKAAVSWFPKEAWMVSAAPAVTAIIMVRWGPWCAIHAAVGGVVSVLARNGNWQECLIWGIGNLAALAVLPLEKKWGWKKFHESVWMLLLFGAMIVLSMQVGRAVMALILGESPEGIWRMTALDSITYIFTLTIVWIASRLDGILEAQMHYLKRLNNETEQ